MPYFVFTNHVKLILLLTYCIYSMLQIMSYSFTHVSHVKYTNYR